MQNPFANHQEELQQLIDEYGITYLALFGSRARGDHRPDSDYDLLIDFQEKSENIYSVSDKLAKLLGAKADTIPVRQLNRHVAPFALADLITISGSRPKSLSQIVPAKSGLRQPTTYINLILDEVARVKSTLDSCNLQSIKKDKMLIDALNYGFRRVERKGSKLRLHFPKSKEYLELADYFNLLTSSIPQSVSNNIPQDTLTLLIKQFDRFEQNCKMLTRKNH